MTNPEPRTVTVTINLTPEQKREFWEDWQEMQKGPPRMPIFIATAAPDPEPWERLAAQLQAAGGRLLTQLKARRND